MMGQPPMRTAICRVLRDNPGRWMTSIEIAEHMPCRIANTPRSISSLLRGIYGDTETGIERMIDPVTKKRYYRFIDRETG